MSAYFLHSATTRDRIVFQQKKRIVAAYRSVYTLVKKMPRRTTSGISSVQAEKQNLIRFGDIALSMLFEEQDALIERFEDDMVEAALAVVDDNFLFMYNLGMTDMDDLFRYGKHDAQDVVKAVMSGALYDSKMSIRDRVCADRAKMRREILVIIEAGVRNGKDIKDIMDDVSEYFNPSKKAAWRWAGVHGVRKVPQHQLSQEGKTGVQHTYQEMFVKATKDNPFVVAYQWFTSGQDNVCAVCIEREQSDQFGLGAGVFPKDSLPLDHPNGMCTFEPIIDYGTK